MKSRDRYLHLCPVSTFLLAIIVYCTGMRKLRPVLSVKIRGKLSQVWFNVNSSQNVVNFVNLSIFYFFNTWYILWLIHIIRKPMCLPFQRHLIICNRLLLIKDTAPWIWLGHKPNVPKFNILSADQSTLHSKSMEWKDW